jgi:hypothetical protein
MQTCTLCDTPLVTPLDHYGALHAPVCQACWLRPPFPCPDCNDGEFTCARCSGDGDYYYPCERQTVYCYDCEGSGTVSCPLCRGRASIAAVDLHRLEQDQVDMFRQLIQRHHSLQPYDRAPLPLGL